VSRTLQFQFEELPLVIEAGYEAADVAGHAEIAYHRDGEWSIRAIALDGARRLTHAPHELLMASRDGRTLPLFARQPVALDAGDPLYLRIYHRLEHDWRARVQSAVIEQLAADRDSAADERADHRRALRAVG
jgi:hypothetical protein